MAQNAIPESAASLSTLKENSIAAVHQPQRMESILSMLDTLAAVDRVSESVAAKPQDNWSSGQSGGTGAGHDDKVSAREYAIAHLPAAPEMQRKLIRTIEKEVYALQKEVHQAARRASKPGNAHKLTLLYARMRRLNSLLATLREAAVDLIRRMYIRMVIDHQSIV